MKLLRISNPGREIPCTLDAGGRARDVPDLVADVTLGVEGPVEQAQTVVAW